MWIFLTWIILDIPEPVQFTLALTFAHCHNAGIEGRRWDQINQSPRGGSKENIKPFAWDKKKQTDGRVRRCLPHSVALLLPVLFSSRGTVSLVQMLGFHVWLEHFHCLSDKLFFMDNGRGWALSGCQALKLVCTKQRLRRVWLWQQSSLGLQASHIGHVVVREMCRNYMWLWPESKLRQRWPHPTRPHVCTKPKKKKRKKQHGWHQLWTELLNRSVDGSRNLEKPLNSPSGGLGWFVCVHVCE